MHPDLRPLPQTLNSLKGKQHITALHPLSTMLKTFQPRLSPEKTRKEKEKKEVLSKRRHLCARATDRWDSTLVWCFQSVDFLTIFVLEITHIHRRPMGMGNFSQLVLNSFRNCMYDYHGMVGKKHPLIPPQMSLHFLRALSRSQMSRVRAILLIKVVLKCKFRHIFNTLGHETGYFSANW